jgi:hypothetical protein
MQHADTNLLVYMNEGQNRTFSNVNSLHGIESKANISFLNTVTSIKPKVKNPKT